ncbi:PQQ-dependent sugar dehydrogenase [Deinococcus humi]|uniref:Glucose/arabinose dehydrogenase n=1 Tax=Deinococcus humi TaxID=662880 RepID=A0A7W8JV73_9DEIO|nr:sorbosone dehydrogenase family protein [Deinococcus humi]MBB5363845.1 glucose/arabinose dehydrogenase [Deinococcus humi]GGO31772.1 sorbosone dehydrogenase [Deinococcus humi]
MLPPNQRRAAMLGGLLTLALGSCAVVQRPDTAKPNAGLSLPAGFRASIYAQDLGKPRLMAFAPNGDLFVTDEGKDPGTGRVLALLDRDHDGRLETTQIYLSGLNQPNSLAFHGGFMYVANTDGIIRVPYQAGDVKPGTEPEKIIDLPAGGQHHSRTIVFGPDDKLYVAAGSTCNVCEETDPHRASVWVYDADGSNGRPYATGLRNAVGLEWFEGTLYATANGRDMAGNDTPPESFFRVMDGQNYGWPYCYPVAPGEPQVWDKDFGKKSPEVCQAAQPSFATTTAHAAPLGMAFYTGNAFPAEYRGQMFVALHGSWNRPQKSGYSVITVDPKTGTTRDFMTGFLGALGLSTSGRPADVQMAPDGALFVTDDGNGVLYRVTYQQP